MTRRVTRTLTGRLTLLAVVVCVATLAVLTVTFNLLLEKSVDSDANGRLRARAAAALTTLSVAGGRLRVREAANDFEVDDRIWIYDRTRALERPPANSAVQAAADRVASAGRRFADVPSHATRLYSTPVVRNGRRYGTVVAGVSLAGYDRTTDNAQFGSAVFALFVALIVVAVMRAAVRGALRPVAAMTARAGEWGAHDLDQRFGRGDRPAELDQLATTFDDLLDRIAASLRHEQRLSAELSHELRTPLARVAGEAEMLLRRPRTLEEHRAGAEAIRASARQMTRILDTLMAAARAEAGLTHGRSRVGEAVAAAVDAYGEEAGERGVTISVDAAAGPVHAGVEADVVEGVLRPLLANACRHAASAVRVSGRRENGRVVIEVVDDGPGVAAGERERIFEPGVRGAGTAYAGAGLGLALARRLARAAGGEVSAAAEPRGARFRVELPPG